MTNMYGSVWSASTFGAPPLDLRLTSTSGQVLTVMYANLSSDRFLIANALCMKVMQEWLQLVSQSIAFIQPESSMLSNFVLIQVAAKSVLIILR